MSCGAHRKRARSLVRQATNYEGGKRLKQAAQEYAEGMPSQLIHYHRSRWILQPSSSHACLRLDQHLACNPADLL